MIQTLELTNIRSYKSGLFEFGEGVNIIVGPNASGKTNLLESIHMVARGHAFKSDDVNMISFDADWGRIESMVSDDQKRVVKLVREPFKKRFEIDGVEKMKLLEPKQLPTVLFEPTHLLMLGGEPDRRRSYLDELLTQTVVGYGALLRDYKRTLAQRNRLLKADEFDRDHMFVWDIRLSDLASKVVEVRLRYTQYLAERLSNDYQSVSGNNEILTISYESKLQTDHYAEHLLQQLKNHIDIDKARGYTGYGPHRDDIRITLKGQDARNSASRGETRSIVLALKIAELHVIENKSGRKPILLLDDVFSELDGKRRRTLAQTLQDYQVFITTTDADVAIEHFSKLSNIIPL